MVSNSKTCRPKHTRYQHLAKSVDRQQIKSDPHELLQRPVAGSQLGHGKGGGDADGGHEDVGLGTFAGRHLFVQ